MIIIQAVSLLCYLNVGKLLIPLRRDSSDIALFIAVTEIAYAARYTTTTVLKDCFRISLNCATTMRQRLYEYYDLLLKSLSENCFGRSILFTI